MDRWFHPLIALLSILMKCFLVLEAGMATSGLWGANSMRRTTRFDTIQFSQAIRRMEEDISRRTILCHLIESAVLTILLVFNFLCPHIFYSVCIVVLLLQTH